MDHSELGKPRNGFRYKFLEPSEYDEALKVLQTYLYPELIELGCKEGLDIEDWIELWTRMMKDGNNLSYIAIHEESGEIAAVRMIGLVENSSTSDLNCSYPSYFKHKSNIEFIKQVADMNKNLNFFEMYNITKYPELYGLCVKTKYRQKGIAGEMYERGMKFLQKRGFLIVKGSFSSPYSRRAGVKNGFQELIRRRLLDMRNDNGEQLNPGADPEKYLDFGVFDLRKTKY